MQQSFHLPGAILGRRVGLCGGTQLNLATAKFCQFLGAALAEEGHVQLVTGGFKHQKKKPEIPSADWSYIKGAKSVLDHDGATVVNATIQTLIPDPKLDRNAIVRFDEGHVLHLPGRSLQARRFSLVRSVDVLLAVHGGNGTRGMIELALVLDLPVLPVPFTGGTSREMWDANKSTICKWFDIPPATLRRWERLSLETLDDTSYALLAAEVVQYLLRLLRPQCLIMMPFTKGRFDDLYKKALRPAIAAVHLAPVRIDREHVVGNVVAALREAAHNCVCGVAILTGNNPNVTYEVGLLHAQDKPVVLACHFDGKTHDLPRLPYDLSVDSVIGYSDSKRTMLRRDVEAALRKLLGGQSKMTYHKPQKGVGRKRRPRRL